RARPVRRIRVNRRSGPPHRPQSHPRRSRRTLLRTHRTPLEPRRTHRGARMNPTDPNSPLGVMVSIYEITGYDMVSLVWQTDHTSETLIAEFIARWGRSEE